MEEKIKLRDKLADIALQWQASFGVAPSITSSISEYDAAMLVGMSEKEYSDYMRDKTAVAKGTDFVYRNIKKYLCFIFCVLLVGACSSTKGSGKDTLFCELDKEIQDTLQSVSQKVLEEDYAPQAMIDFSGNCKFTERNIGPWVISIQIEDTVNKISVSLPTNAPMPYIVHKYTVYYPEEYNLLVMGFDKNTKFRTIRMK